MTHTHAGRDHVHDVDCLATDLSELGLPRDGDLLVHISMRQIGWIEGGAQTLIVALREVAGEDCTIVVPTHTTINSPTSRAFRTRTEGMTDREVDDFVRQLSGFDPNHLASEMGMLADYVLQRDDAVRSAHPLVSFAALGSRAAGLMAVHELESHLGNESPLGALYETDASILLLGVGYDACSALHLAEYRLDGPPPLRSYSCYVVDSGVRALREFTAIDLDDSDFPVLGMDFEASRPVGRAIVGDAQARSMSLRDAVDFAIGWMNHHRKAGQP